MVKVTLRWFLLLVFCLPTIAQSQVLLSQYTYQSGVDSTQWITLPSTATTLLSNDGDVHASSVTNLGFDVLFAGTTYSQFSVNTDGNLRLGPIATSGIHDYGGPFATMDDNISDDLPKINGFGYDGEMGANGYVKYATIGTAPNRIFVVEFKTAEYYSSTSEDDLCWQVQFFESSKDIQLVYSPQAVSVQPEYVQIGMASSETDAVIIDPMSNNISYELPVFYDHYGWPMPNTYYRFSLPSGCLPPANITLQSLTDNSATLHWDTISHASQWEYLCTTANSPNWDSGIVATTLEADLTGLTPNTEYHFFVRTHCDILTSSEPIQFDFTTLCAASALPYTENFDSYTTDVAHGSTRPLTYPNHTLPSCWLFAPMSDVYGGPACWLTNMPNYDFINGEYNQIDSVSLRFITSNSQLNYAILPLMEAPLSSLQINFDYATEQGASALTLGVVTNPIDFSTFIPLQICNPSANIASVEHLFIYDTILDATHDYYIAFKIGSGYNKVTVLDNIVVDYLPTCIAPGDVSILSVTADDVRLNWRTNAPSSQVAYRKTSSNLWLDTIVSDTIVTLTNFEALTDYEVKVRAICASTDTSSWSAPISFRTPCTTRHMPFYEDFSTIFTSLSELACWSFYDVSLDRVLNGTATLVEQDESDCYVYPYEYVFDDAGISFDIYGFTYHEWLVTPQIEFSTDARLTFDMALTTYGETTQGVSGNVDDDRFLVLATTDNGQTWTTLAVWDSASPTRYQDISVTPHTVTIDMTQFTYQNVRIAFYGESHENGGDNEIHIGHVLIKTLGTTTCPVPTNITDNATETTATITWNSETSTCGIALKEENSDTWQTPIYVDTTSYTFNNLIPGQTYNYRICRKCAENVYSDWVEGSFTTLPTTCLPPTIRADVNGLQATLSWDSLTNAQAYELHIFNADFEQFQEVNDTIYTITNLTANTQYSAAIRTLCTDTRYSEWSDTITFNTTDCYPVSNITVSDITENSARITWTPGGEENSWTLMYGITNFDDIDALRINTDEPTAHLSNLESGISYDLYIRSNCATDFHSAWSSPAVTFQTKGSTESIDGINGDYQLIIYPNPTNGATTISLSGIEGKVTISLLDINGRQITSEELECAQDCEKRLDVTNLAQGTYFIRVLGANINSVRKLIVR